jgi:tetratricopeptide (TPR) repeat protein
VFAEIFERKGEYSKAAQEYQTAALLDPKYPDTLYQLGRLYRKQNKIQQAEYWLERHRTLTTFVPKHQVLRQKLQQTKNAEQARKLRMELAQFHAQAGILTEAVEQMRVLQTEKPDATLETAIRTLSQNPGYRLQTAITTPTHALMAQADRLLTQGRVADALPLYFLVVRRNRYYAEGLQNVGLCLQAQNKTEQAIPFLVDAVRTNPGLARARFALGDIAHVYKQLTTAQSHYEKGLQSEPKNAEAWFRLGNICREALAETASYQAFEKAYTLQPDEPRYAREWADALADAGKPKEAQMVLRSLLQKANDAEAQTQLALLLLKQEGDVSEARTLLKQALSSNPSDDFVRFGLAQVNLQSGKAMEARSTLSSLAQRNPRSQDIWFVLGRACRTTGDVQGAKQAFARAEALETQFAKERTLASQLSHKSSDVALRVQLARLQEQSGDTVNALANYEQALQQEPNRADWKKQCETLRQQLRKENKWIDLDSLTLLHQSVSS